MEEVGLEAGVGYRAEERGGGWWVSVAKKWGCRCWAGVQTPLQKRP